MTINRIHMKGAMPVTENRLLVGTILALYVLLSYSRFHYSSEVYCPLFSAALNPNFLEDDIFIRDHFFSHSKDFFHRAEMEETGKVAIFGLGTPPTTLLMILGQSLDKSVKLRKV